MNKIAIFLAVGFEEIEAVTIIDVLRRGGIGLDIISVSGGEYVEGSHGIIMRCDKLFYNVDYDNYDFLILPGGQPGTDHLNSHDGLKNLLVKFNEQDKKIAAICAAPSVLGELGILEGKEAICYPSYEKHLKGAIISEKGVVKSQNIITGKGPSYAIDFTLELLRLFISEKEVMDIKKAIEANK